MVGFYAWILSAIDPLRATGGIYQLTRKSWRGTSLTSRSAVLCGIGNVEKVRSRERRLPSFNALINEVNGFTWSMPSPVNGHKESHMNNTPKRQANHMFLKTIWGY